MARYNSLTLRNLFIVWKLFAPRLPDRLDVFLFKEIPGDGICCRNEPGIGLEFKNKYAGT
jgi:hypothetical protein